MNTRVTYERALFNLLYNFEYTLDKNVIRVMQLSRRYMEKYPDVSSLINEPRWTFENYEQQFPDFVERLVPEPLSSGDGYYLMRIISCVVLAWQILKRMKESEQGLCVNDAKKLMASSSSVIVERLDLVQLLCAEKSIPFRLHRELMYEFDECDDLVYNAAIVGFVIGVITTYLVWRYFA